MTDVIGRRKIHQKVAKIKAAAGGNLLKGEENLDSKEFAEGNGVPDLPIHLLKEHHFQEFHFAVRKAGKTTTRFHGLLLSIGDSLLLSYHTLFVPEKLPQFTFL